jgi:hypothetical protein
MIKNFNGEITHVGLVLDRAANYVGDGEYSNFATVWNVEKNASEPIIYGYTRSENMATALIDAPAEIVALWNAEKALKAKKIRVGTKIQKRAEMIQVRKAAGLETYHQLKKLYYVAPISKHYELDRLLTAKLRSGFRISLRQQIINWLNDPAPKFRNPLSPRQWEFV